MEKHEINHKINEVSKSILSYCMSRTSSQQDAEDLAQDIFVALVKSLPNIRDDQSFYKFMWTVANNIYSGWYRKKMKSPYHEVPLDTALGEEAFDFATENDETLYLLRRELSLMSEKYRKVTILYYLENKSCSDIAYQLSISENMVKYLLFKARKSLKEGMDMNRNYGEQSYNPKTLTLMFMGEGPNQFSPLVDDKLIPQNILWACYNDELTGEEISLQIGVALPYLESELNTLTHAGLLLKKGNKYTTNIIILSKQFNNEASKKAYALQNQLVDCIHDFLVTNEDIIKSTGFIGCQMSHNTYIWQMLSLSLNLAFEQFRDENMPKERPLTALGNHAYVWALEGRPHFLNMYTRQGTQEGVDQCYFSFIGLSPHSSKDTHYLVSKETNIFNVLFKLAKGQLTTPNEYDQELLAKLIQYGYLLNIEDQLIPTMPIYTMEQYNQVTDLLRPLVDTITQAIEKIYVSNCSVLKNHTPSHLKKTVKELATLSLLEYVFSMPMDIMLSKNYLTTNWIVSESPNIYIVI